MIHLDTNYLIGMVTLNSPINWEITKWMEKGETLAASAVAWSEFMTGPLSPEQLQRARIIMGRNIVPFRAAEAESAAALYNRAGRKRETRGDTFVAATAIVSNARLATKNKQHFAIFQSAGLKLT